jgi:hypothetical protein
MIRQLGFGTVRLLTNNRVTVAALERFGNPRHRMRASCLPVKQAQRVVTPREGDPERILSLRR